MAYWIVAIALIVFGFLGSFSIGAPFLLMGVALIALGPVRGRGRIFWPVFLGLLTFNIVYWAIAPFSCSTTTSMTVGADASVSSTVCSSLIGLRYTGLDDSAITGAPATMVGLAAGLSAAVAASVVLRMRRMRLPEA